jgi:hypothetical protein
VDETSGVSDGVSGSSQGSFQPVIARLQQGTSAAATTLLKIMLDQTSPASTRVRAAERIMNHAAKAMELEDIGVRVSALEESTKDQNR